MQPAGRRARVAQPARSAALRAHLRPPRGARRFARRHLPFPTVHNIALLSLGICAFQFNYMQLQRVWCWTARMVFQARVRIDGLSKQKVPAGCELPIKHLIDQTHENFQIISRLIGIHYYILMYIHKKRIKYYQFDTVLDVNNLLIRFI